MPKMNYFYQYKGERLYKQMKELPNFQDIPSRKDGYEVYTCKKCGFPHSNIRDGNTVSFIVFREWGSDRYIDEALLVECGECNFAEWFRCADYVPPPIIPTIPKALPPSPEQQAEEEVALVLGDTEAFMRELRKNPMVDIEYTPHGHIIVSTPYELRTIFL